MVLTGCESVMSSHVAVSRPLLLLLLLLLLVLALLMSAAAEV
jgi:hypothetical protein